MNKWSERWPGLGFGWSHCSCWPRDRWLDPVDHQERVRWMVCAFCFYPTMMFWMNVISKWPPSSPQHNHHDRPPVEHGAGLWQDPSLEGRGHCRAGHAQVYNIIVLHLGDLHCFFFFSNLLKIEGGIFQGMCQNAGVDLSFINRWVKCRSDSWISRNVCNCSNIVKHRQCRKFVMPIFLESTCEAPLCGSPCSLADPFWWRLWKNTIKSKSGTNLLIFLKGFFPRLTQRLKFLNWFN